MDDKRLESLFSALGVEERKGFLASIVTALTRGLREEERRRRGADFSLKAFHDTLLRNGSLPISFHARLLRDGEPQGAGEQAGAGVRFRCPGDCGAGTYRAEVTLGGRPWILTNPLLVQ